MTRHPLDGVRAKLDRADKHFAFLHTKIGAYLQQKPYQFVTKQDAGHGHPGALLKVTEQPSLSLSTIIGDVVHNARSSLDYIVYELMIHNGKTPTFQTQFPICETPKAFQDEAFGKKRLVGVSLEAVKVIEAAQPYWSVDLAGAPHPMWLVHKLSNIDKHRTLNLATLGVTATIDYVATDGHIIRTDHIERSVYDGGLLHTMPKHFLDEKVQVTGTINLHIAFQDDPVAGIDVLESLEEALGYLRQAVLPSVEPFFDPAL